LVIASIVVVLQVYHLRERIS